MKDFLQLIGWLAVTILSFVVAIAMAIKGLYIGMALGDFAYGMWCEFLAVILTAIGIGLVDKWNTIWIKRKDVENEDHFL